MTGRRYFLLLLQLVWLTDAAWAQQRPAYSLQAAVDELHRREAAKYPLNAPPSQQRFLGNQDYWDDDTDSPAYTNNLRNRHRLNKALAKYLERENYETDHDGSSLWPFGGFEVDEGMNIFSNYPDEKKRSTPLRERDRKYENPTASVFRERETQVPSNPEHAELTEQFLREIEEAQEHEREERYKEALRQLWEKYQQKENELEGDLFEEKKRIRTPPYYMLMQKKRSYPVLPWLPYSDERKKRFPVSKRSAKRSLKDNTFMGNTEDKVAKELSELFGAPVEEKKKRSTNEQNSSMVLPSTHSPETASTMATHEKQVNKTDSAVNPKNLEHLEHHDPKNEHGNEQHAHMKDHKHNKRSGDHSHFELNTEEDEEEESEEGVEHDDVHDDEHDEEHEEDFEGDEEERKKKRDVSGDKDGKKAVTSPAEILHDEMMKSRRKKSIDWSKYFGLDRKKKSVNAAADNSNLDVKKRSAEDDSYFNNKMNHDLDPKKIENMNKKLRSIEDFIIAETVKYTGTHEGNSNPDEMRRLKDHVLSRLATAYSLEKMRRALDKLRQSVDNENHLVRNIIESEPRVDATDSLDNQKRLSVKKEKVQGEDKMRNDKNKEINVNALQNLDFRDRSGDSSEEEEDIKQKKKRNGYLRYPEQRNDFVDFEDNPGIVRYEPLNDAYLGNKNYMIGSNQCPIIESMAERCRGVDLLSGDINQELLPICGIHQICYLCGTLPLACDYQYLSEADSICGINNDCQAAARSVLMILRGTPGPQLGPRECLKNPCLHSAMREIGL